MCSDEYDFLEKSFDDECAAPAKKSESWKDRSSRHRRSSEHDMDEKSPRRLSRDAESDGDRDRDRSYRAERKERDRNHEREHDKDRRQRSGSRPRRSEREEEYERERERERERRSASRSKRGEREEDYERERRSGSWPRRGERDEDMERARSRDRVPRESELEREMREIRKLKDKKESEEPEVYPERDQRTVFAYQMPLKATEKDVYEFFSQVGKVRDVRLIMDRNSRRSKGVGYIEFYDVMPVETAIRLSGQLLLGQPVMVKHSEAEKNLAQSNVGSAHTVGSERKLYVGNLHFNMTENHLLRIFEAFGPVDLVQLPIDIETGHCKGFGFVQFVQKEHAKIAQQTLNGTLEIAGRTVKVSSVIEHIGVQDAGSNATDFDDDDGGGLALNARSRALLMQKLDRTGTATSIAESLGVPSLNGAVPNSAPFGVTLNGKATAPGAFPVPLSAPVIEPIGSPSECLLLKNMFDPSTETDPDFDLDIQEDVNEECSKFGSLKHIYVDKNSRGHVYLRFSTVAAAAGCQRAMHMRWFARRCISATFMRTQDYEAKLKSAI